MTRVLTSFKLYVGDRRGAGAVEFALLALVFIGMMLGVIDLSRLAWEMNSARAATRAGVRLAVVLAPAASTLVNYNATGTYGAGQVVPADATGVGPFTCRCALACTSGSGNCGASNLNAATFNAVVARMRQYYPRVNGGNVVIRYQHVGVGISGNPCAPDVEPMVTVSVSGIPFRPMSLRVFGVTPFNIPSSASSMSGESLGVTACS